MYDAHSTPLLQRSLFEYPGRRRERTMDIIIVRASHGKGDTL